MSDEGTGYFGNILTERLRRWEAVGERGNRSVRSL